MSNPVKKRKGNNGQATAMNVTHHYDSFWSSLFGYFTGRSVDFSSEYHSNDQFMQQTLSHMQNMNQMMTRMEEKLDNLSNVESRCEMLEAKCSSLETKLESTSQLMKDHIERLESKVESGNIKAQKNHEYSQMLLRNQRWEYSAQVRTYEYWMIGEQYDPEKAEYLEEISNQLKEKSIEMRRGNIPSIMSCGGVEKKGILLYPIASHDGVIYTGHIKQHWREFTAALKQFTPVINMLPDEHPSFFKIVNVALDRDTMLMLKKALIDAPFQSLYFDYTLDVEDTVYGGMSIDAIIEIVENNNHLHYLDLTNYDTFSEQHVDRFCNAVKNNRSLVELDLYSCVGNSNVGNAIMTSLLTNCGLKLEKLWMASCWLTSDVSALLADFISRNRKLKELDISGNPLNEVDAVLIVNALRRNTTLRRLYIYDSGAITNSSVEAFRSVLYDDSSLNAVSDSNHSCELGLDDDYPWDLNTSAVTKENRGRKIYTLLSCRHRDVATSNVQHFGDIDVKLLPDILEAVLRYSKHTNEDINNEDGDDSETKVGSTSIVYEIMRKWEKAFNLYESPDARRD